MQCWELPRLRNEEVRRRTKVEDIVKQISIKKWRWAGHVARDNTKWTKEVMQWRPWEHKRSIGRPQTRWRDDLQKIAGKNWMLAAQNRQTWKQMEEAYVQEWISTG